MLVARGTYFEVLVIPRRIVLMSEEGADVTTIDASLQGPVITVEIPGERSAILGFRITNGYGSNGAQAGGIHAEADFGVGGRIIVRNNIVEYNRSLAMAGGVFAVRASTVEENLIQYNNLSAGKGTSALEASGVVRRNTIRYNGDLAGGDLHIVHIHDSDTGPSTVEENVIVDNGSPVISVVTIVGSSGTSVRNNTISSSTCSLSGVAIGGPGGFNFRNNIVVHLCDDGLLCHFTGEPQNIACNNVITTFGDDYAGDCAGYAGNEGNFSAPPLFCDPSLGDYRLQESSPCAPANSPPGCGLIGALPVCAVSNVAEGSAPSQNVDFRVEPNPATQGQVEFILRDEGSAKKIEIYDGAGRLVDVVYPSGLRERWLAAGRNPRGVYFARLSSGHSSSVRKFVVLH